MFRFIVKCYDECEELRIVKIKKYERLLKKITNCFLCCVCHSRVRILYCKKYIRRI